MQKRKFSREFKLGLIHQIINGQKRFTEACREYGIAESILSRWLKEYREFEENAFLPKESEKKSLEHLERKRAWDRNYYQRHKTERRAAADERKYRLYEYLRQIKAQASCKHCGENHPAVLQFHHRNPGEKEFEVSAFIYHQKGGLKKLEAEIAKCDVLCANCHLKYHYINSPRCANISDSPTDDFGITKHKTNVNQEESFMGILCDKYFPEGIDAMYLTIGFWKHRLI